MTAPRELLALVCAAAFACGGSALAQTVARAGPAQTQSPLIPNAVLPTPVVLGRLTPAAPDLRSGIQVSSLDSKAFLPLQSLLRLAPEAQEKLAVVLARTRAVGAWQVTQNPGAESAVGQPNLAEGAARPAFEPKVDGLIAGVLSEFSLKQLQSMPEADLAAVLKRAAGASLRPADRGHLHHGPDVPHPHAHELRSGSLDAGQRAAIRKALVFNAVFVAGEAVGAAFTGSVALAADAAHSAVDVALMGAMLFTARLSGKIGALYQRAIQAALSLLIGSAMIAAGAETAVHALGHLRHPVGVPGFATLALAVAAVASNVISAWLVRGQAKDSPGLKAVSLHFVTDIFGSLGIIVSSALMMRFGWSWPDPVVSFVIVGLILWISVPLTIRALRQLLRRR